MKKIITVCFSFLLLSMLCACGASNDAENQNEAINEIIADVNEIVDDINEIIDGINADTVVDIEPTPTDVIEQESEASLFDAWMEIEHTVSERYQYETLIDGFLIADDEIAHGWIDAGTKAFLKVIKGDSIPQNATTADYMSAYRGLDDRLGSSKHCIRDFFTVDEYNDSTNTGIYNFLETIDQLENEKFGGRDLVTITEGGGVSWDFDDAEVATALGISEELITILIHAAVDAGFAINFD